MYENLHVLLVKDMIFYECCTSSENLHVLLVTDMIFYECCASSEKWEHDKCRFSFWGVREKAFKIQQLDLMHKKAKILESYHRLSFIQKNKTQPINTLS